MSSCRATNAKAYPKTAFQKTLADKKACAEARVWVGSKTLAEAWAKCRRSDWLLWLAYAAGHGVKANAASDLALRVAECQCGQPSCVGHSASRKAATAIRKAIPLSTIRAGLK